MNKKCCNCQEVATTEYMGDPCCQTCYEFVEMHSPMRVIDLISKCDDCIVGYCSGCEDLAYKSQPERPEMSLKFNYCPMCGKKL